MPEDESLTRCSDPLTASSIKLGASLGRWTSTSLARQLEQLAKVLRVVTIFPYPFELPIPRQTVRQVRHVLADTSLELRVHGPIWELYTGSTDATVRSLAVDKVRRAVDWAVLLDAEHITIHPGLNAWPSVWPDLAQQSSDAQCQSIREIAHYAAGSGLSIGLENMPPGVDIVTGFSDMSLIEILLDELPMLGMTLDTGHAHMTGADLASTVMRFGARLNHLHVHDNDGHADQHLAVGSGTIDWPSFCDALKRIGYSGALEIERSLEDGGVLESLSVLADLLAISAWSPSGRCDSASY